MTTAATYAEHELVAALKQQDAKAFAWLYDHYSGALLSIIAGVIGRTEAAEDVLQEVFVQIYRHIGRYDAGRGRLYTWMAQIARNAAIDHARSKGYRQSQQNRSLDNAVYERESGEAANPDMVGIRSSLRHLKPEQRTVLELAYFGGLTQEEISAALGLPLGTVKTRVRTALQQLRRYLSDQT